MKKTIDEQTTMHLSHATRAVRLPWLSWVFLAFLFAASMLLRKGTGLRTPSNSPAAHYAIGAPH